MKKNLKTTILLALTAILTAVFWITDIDVKIQEFFYAGGCVWKYADIALVKILYKYGTYPALAAGLIAVAVFIMSFFNGKFLDKRRAAFFFILVFLVGPGLLVNVIFKSYGGRPRPRDIPQFCGMWEYRPPFAFGTPGKGHSFPCGHSSVGFALGALYFVLRRRNQKAALAAIALSALYGSALGVTRMAQGGHFFSDVIFSAVLVYAPMTALAVFIKPESEAELKISRGSAFLYGLLAVIFSAAAFLLSVPYYKQKSVPVSSKAHINAVLERGSIRVPADVMPEVKIKVSGFGTPGLRYEERITDSACALMISSDIRGFAVELNPLIEVNNGSRDASFIIKDGDIEYLKKTEGGTIDLVTIKGDIHFRPAQGSMLDTLILRAEKGSVYVEIPETAKIKTPHKIRIEAGKRVVFVNKSKELNSLKAESEKASGAKELIILSKEGSEFSVKAGKRAEFR